MPRHTIHTLVLLNTCVSLVLIAMFLIAVLYRWGVPWMMLAVVGIPLAAAVLVTSVRLERRFLSDTERHDAEGSAQ